jgi:hypothetical protein
VIAVDSISANKSSNKYLFTTLDGRAKLDSLGLRYKILKEFADFPVTRLTGKFINRKTRHLEVKPKYLLKIDGLDSPVSNAPVVFLPIR